MEKGKLERSTPEEQGVSSQSILKFIEAVEQMRTKDMNQDIHSFMMLRHGYVIAEGWWNPYKRNDPHMLFSLSKSFTSTAIGFAVAEKRLSVEDKVVSYFQEECPNPSELLERMRIKDLLTMATGHVVDTIQAIHNREDKNWVKAFLEVPVEKEPGTYFKYNTGATYMLSVILQKITGMKLIDYLRPRLFEPLKIEDVTWTECPMGYNTGGFGLSLKTEDIAKFGQLYLNRGAWEGKQILSEKWVEEATTSQISNGDEEDNDWSQGYGYQFWRNRHNSYRGDGAFGQFCFVLPDMDAVIVITGGTKDTKATMNLVWEHLLPGFHTKEIEEHSQYKTLEEKLSSLSVLLPEELDDETREPWVVQMEQRFLGKRYALEKNEFDFDWIELQKKAEDFILISSTGNQKKEFTVIPGKWIEDVVEYSDHKEKIALTGKWMEYGSLLLYCRVLNAPFAVQIKFVWKDKELKMMVKWNLAFEEQTWKEVNGRLIE